MEIKIKRRSFVGLLVGAFVVPFLPKQKKVEVGPWVGKLGTPDIVDDMGHGLSGYLNPHTGEPYKLPTGYISYYVGEKVPDGWLPCDGSLVDSGRYSKLAEILVPLGGHKLPDIPGAIIRT